ncbi:MAG: hypothetical protein Unbinned4098contig1000_25 [Prokaryotic dsDNA virus sp.]|nr:MAG: hypothetical protein Unbinned4098contig1000_25 [Prokaryotic dsDNA virus sp.]|tara:strand:- start:4739 stop:5353 length:615 start_codon:yes stop_codon:yes gene_type:complete
MASPYPQYLDKAFTIRRVADTGSTYKPLTSLSPRLLNFLAEKIVATQDELHFDMSDMGANFFTSLSSSDKNLATVLKRRSRMEHGWVFYEHASGTSTPFSTTVNYQYTTNGGSTQLFASGADPIVFTRVWYINNETSGSITTSNFDLSDNENLYNFNGTEGFTHLVDSSGYRYGFTFDFHASNPSSGKSNFYLIQWISFDGFQH